MADDDWDVESQATGSSGRRGTQMDEWVGTTLSPDKERQWKMTIGTRPIGPKGHYNPHGLLAAQRYVAEKFACLELLANEGCVVVDVGAAPHRTFAHLVEKGRYMMPQVHAGDRTRVGRVPPDVEREHICHCRFEECGCWKGQKRAYLFTHSAYYIDPACLYAELCDDDVQDALVVEHCFDDCFGGYYGEASWSVSRDVVTMSVTGNAGPYIHPLPAWQVGWVGEGGASIQCEVLKYLDGVTRVVRLTPVRVAEISNVPMTWDEVEANAHKSGPVQFSEATRNAVADNARFTHVTFDVHRIRKFGPVLYTGFTFLKGETVDLTIPVNGVSQVAEYCADKPRTPALLTEVSFLMKNRWARARIPPGLKARTLTATIALGFVANLPFEMDVQYTMQQRFTWRMQVHNTLLQFGQVAVRSFWWLVFGFVLTIVGYVLFEAIDTNEPSQIAVGVLLPLLLICCCGSVARVVEFREGWRQYMERGWVSSYSSSEDPRTPLLGNGFHISRSLPLPGSRFVKPVAEKTTGRVTLGPTREKVFEPSRILVSGILADGAVPNALHTSQDAEHSAVTNRVLRTRKNPDPGALAKCAEAYSSRDFRLVKPGVDTSLPAFLQWISKLKKSYPAIYIQAMIDAWKVNQGVLCPPVATKAFLKIEKSAAAVKLHNAKATKPRLIQPPEDVDKAMTGPSISQLYEKCRTAWNGVTSRLMYASGYTLREVGSAVDLYLLRHPDAIGYSVDMASYDSTLSLPIQLMVFQFYVSLGMPEWLTTWLMRIRPRGRTPNGVSYAPERVYFDEDKAIVEDIAMMYRKHKLKVVVRKAVKILEEEVVEGWEAVVEDFQMTSGRMDTNLTDTVALFASFAPLLATDIDFLLLGCGDDGFLLLPPDCRWIIEEVEALQRGLGLEPEGKVSSRRCDWEFCSKLFWFATDDDGSEITVLGAKPFRGIARMGVNTTLPGAANAAQAALSVRVESGHVPFLGPFADRTMELCRERRVRPTGRVEWAAMRGDRRYACSVQNYIITQERYGLGRANEDEFKTRLSELDSVPIVVQWMPLVDAITVDEA